jgi:hypothetical protein
MSTDKLTYALNNLIPASLDDIIRINRDRCRLALACTSGGWELILACPNFSIS